MLVKSKAKYIQSLSQKKLRDLEGVFLAEGPKIVADLVAEPNINVKELLAVPDWIEQNRRHPAFSSLTITEINHQDLERISSLQTPNQVIAIFEKPSFADQKPSPDSISVLLDTIQDPGNLGTIIRTADWFGIRSIYCSVDSADVFNSKVVQSSMGSIARVRVEYLDLQKLIEDHPDMPVYATALDGENIYSMKKVNGGFIIIGNESKGISVALMQKATHRITIPRKGRAESLNAAVAAGIVLGEISYQLSANSQQH